MKSIKTKIMAFFGLIILAICIGSNIISYVNSLNALRSNLGVLLPEIAKQASTNIESRIDGQLKALESIASRPDIQNPDIPVQDKLKVLSEEGKRLGAIRMGIIDVDGNLQNADGGTAQLKDRDYFQKALKGENAVADPLITPDNVLVVPYTVPIKYNGKVVAVLLETRDGNALSDLTNAVKVAQNGSAFMINSKGDSIANPDPQKVLNKVNDIEGAKTDKSLTKLAEIYQKMITGDTGEGVFHYKGIEKFVGYAPVSGTGWSLAVTMTQDDALSVLGRLKVMDVLSGIIFTIISIILVYFIANSMSKGIKQTSVHLKLLAEGDFTKEIPSKYLKLKDEIGEMMNSMKIMQDSISKMVGKIRESSFNLNKQSENLSSVTGEIADSSQNVTATITEVASGTNSQSEDLISITGILEQFNQKLTGIVDEIQVVGSSSKDISKMALESSEDTNQLNQSVTNVSASFKEFHHKMIELGSEVKQISEITDLIKNIADQTNLLALNAAIEAARAGEAGKGFAVVADEIRQLAEQVKISSDNIGSVVAGISGSTDGMINNSVSMDNELLNQVSVIERSTESFGKIIEAINDVIPKIEAIQTSANNIEEDRKVMTEKMEGISSVAMEISASSEEISASSQEMSASAEEVASSAEILNQATDQMLEEVNRFRTE